MEQIMIGIRRISLLGFGEVGSLIAASLSSLPGVVLTAFDKQFDDKDSKPVLRISQQSNIIRAANAVDLVAGADLVISAVTAGQALEAAQSVLGALPESCWYMDLNSVCPDTKRKCAEMVNGAGARYIEGAVMSPIHPKGMASPVLLAGRFAKDFEPLAKSLGFANCRFFSEKNGQAAATKMCRSVIIKGLESLLAESLLAARHYGVEEEVVGSLGNLMPGVDWTIHSAYMLSRSLEHGARRAEEMHEVAATVAGADVPAHMSSACAKSQEWMAGFHSMLKLGASDEISRIPLADLLDSILSATHLVQQSPMLDTVSNLTEEKSALKKELQA
jgi:3-hydroxyisobutyrate dehydrogenase-like beta-hydroxyacid dehydrogenase